MYSGYICNTAGFRNQYAFYQDSNPHPSPAKSLQKTAPSDPAHRSVWRADLYGSRGRDDEIVIDRRSEVRPQHLLQLGVFSLRS